MVTANVSTSTFSTVTSGPHRPGDRSRHTAGRRLGFGVPSYGLLRRHWRQNTRLRCRLGGRLSLPRTGPTTIRFPDRFLVVSRHNTPSVVSAWPGLGIGKGSANRHDWVSPVWQQTSASDGQPQQAKLHPARIVPDE